MLSSSPGYSLKYCSVLLMLETMHLLEAWGHVLSTILLHLWLKTLVLHCPFMCNCLLFGITTKVKKLQELFVSSLLLVGFDCFFFQAGIKMQPKWELKMLLASPNKSPLNLFHSACLSKLWFSWKGTLDMILEWKQSVGSSGRATSLTALLNEFLPNGWFEEWKGGILNKTYDWSNARATMEVHL